MSGPSTGSGALLVTILSVPAAPDTDLVISLVSSLGHSVLIIDSHDAQSSAVTAARADVVLLDLFAGPDALRFLRKYAARSDRAPVVCIADRRRLELSSEALRLGAVDIVARPVMAQALAAALANAKEFRSLPEREGPELPQPESSGDGLFGASRVMRDVLNVARRVAASRCAVLVVGERGTGREMVARTIHSQGPRAAAAFVKVACPGASVDELRRALDTTPRDGTLYLEDVGELPLDLQVTIESNLRTAEADVEPGFERSPLPNRSMRVIAGTQPRIWSWVDRGIVRRELVDALSVVRIDLPPLRQRAEDIPLLAMHFVKAACRQNDVAPKTFSRGARALMTALPWPGNATELRSLCDRLAVLVPRGVVLLEDVLAHVRFGGAEAIGHRREPLKAARERFERDYIAGVLLHHKGRMGAAAEELGIERTNLYRKIRQLKITWADPHSR